MSDQDDVPVLDDLIERGIEITLSDLGLEEAADDPPLRVEDVRQAELEFEADALADNPALEQAVRRILDEHMELAWQEIRLAIQQHLARS